MSRDLVRQCVECMSLFSVLQLNTEWTQLEVIELINDGTGLGFGIIGGKSTGVVVKTILLGGIADRVSTVLGPGGTQPHNALKPLRWEWHI